MSEREMTASWKEWQGMVVDGTFYLDRYLGGTGRSAVYLTDWGEPNGVPAAIKLMAADESAELHLARWKFASGISHPRLLRVHQAGHCELDGLKLLYVVMEYAEENLSEILAQRPLNEEEGREMISGVLEGLDALHQQELVHGRLKACNIMAVGNQLKISSDGIARAGSRAIYSSAVCPNIYDAPEAATEPLSPAVDIWSLGMTMVEALTQQRPSGKRGADGELELSPLPAPFAEIARHCLLSGPRCRWTTAAIQAHLSNHLSTHLSTMEDRIEQPGVAQPELPQPQAFLPIPEDATAWSLTTLSKPHLGAALAVVLLLASTAAVLTMRPATPSNSPQGRDTAPMPTSASLNTGNTGDTGTPPAQISAATGEPQSVVQSTAPASGIELTPAQAAPMPAAMSALQTNALVPGAAIERPLPSVPLRARRTIHGRVKIKVKVAVDTSGSVERATLDSRAASDYFAGIAMETARRWRFAPAQMNGQNVASEWVLKFEFGRARTKISPIALAAADQHL